MDEFEDKDFDFQVQGSLTEYKQFLESPIWQDFRNFLSSRKEFVMQDMLDLTKEEHSLFFKGEMHSILHMEKLPEYFISLIQAQDDGQAS